MGKFKKISSTNVKFLKNEVFLSLVNRSYDYDYDYYSFINLEVVYSLIRYD
jgi:hypothetical protein